MALNQIEVSDSNREVLVSWYEYAKMYNATIEGVFYTKIVLESEDGTNVVFFRNRKQKELHIEYAIERAHALYDISSAYVVHTDHLMM